MSLSEICFLAIALYLVYRLVFNFILPVAKATRQIRSQFRNMQNMQDIHNMNNVQQPQQQSANGNNRPSSSNNTMGEYIDFEEVKN